MQTRTNTPFATTECHTDNCTANVPDSTRTDYCSTCDNFRQVFGRDPATVDTITVEVREMDISATPRSWQIVVTIDDKQKVRTPFNEEKARRKAREYRSIARAADA